MKRIDLGQAITILAKAQLANDYFLADMQLEQSMMGDDPIASFAKAVYTPDQVTEGDAAALDRYFNYGLVQVLRLSKMRELACADDEMVERQVRYLKWHLGNEVGRRWWTGYRRTAGENKDLVREIDSTLRDYDFSENKRFLDSMLPANRAKA